MLVMLWNVIKTANSGKPATVTIPNVTAHA
jgi:hypothetical protein